MAEIIKTKKQLDEWLTYELKKYGKPSMWLFKKVFGIGEWSLLVRHHTLLRKTEYYTNSKNKIMSMIYDIKLKKFQTKYSMYIPVNTCGKGLHVMHMGPIRINKNVRIGKDCALHVNTAFVAGGLDSGVPVLGDNIIVGIGATVLGRITIANGIAIGANALVNKSFEEEGIAIAGVPAKKISNNGSAQWNKDGKKIQK